MICKIRSPEVFYSGVTKKVESMNELKGHAIKTGRININFYDFCLNTVFRLEELAKLSVLQD